MQPLSIGFFGLLVLKAPRVDTGCTGIMSCQKLVSHRNCPSVARHSSVATAATSSSAVQALSEMLLQKPELMLACRGDLWLSRKAQHLASGPQPSSRQHRRHPRENLLHLSAFHGTGDNLSAGIADPPAALKCGSEKGQEQCAAEKSIKTNWEPCHGKPAGQVWKLTGLIELMVEFFCKWYIFLLSKTPDLFKTNLWL